MEEAEVDSLMIAMGLVGSYLKLFLSFRFLPEAIPVLQLPQVYWYAISIPFFQPHTRSALSRTILAISASASTHGIYALLASILAIYMALMAPQIASLFFGMQSPQIGRAHV